MTQLLDAIIATARLTMLQLLEKASGYTLNNLVLGLGLEGRGVMLSVDQVRAELAWLEQVRLVKLLDLPNGIVVAELTERGRDVALGRSTMPGIERPMPGAR